MIRDTSLKAYYEIENLGPKEKMVYELIRRYPNKTDMELCAIAGISNPNVLRPRRKGILDKGWIEETGKRTCRITGKTCYTWNTKQLSLF